MEKEARSHKEKSHLLGKKHAVTERGIQGPNHEQLIEKQGTQPTEHPLIFLEKWGIYVALTTYPCDLAQV